MSLSTLLKNTQNGLHQACLNCPWRPSRDRGFAFGVSCTEHGVDWSVQTNAVSMLIAQDPGGTTPEATGKLCGYCNSHFSTDHSAQHGFSLWKAAVSLSESSQDAMELMKNHYWTNAIMHGFKAKDKKNKEEIDLEKQRGRARGCCTTVLRDQINFLSPRIIIATGKDACTSLFELKLISKEWDEFSTVFSRQVYREETTLPSGVQTTIYCTYHASATAVNTHVARLYSDETRINLARKIELLPNSQPALNFLRRNQEFKADEKGMRVLLLHWLDIGEGIRQANQEYNLSK